MKDVVTRQQNKGVGNNWRTHGSEHGRTTRNVLGHGKTLEHCGKFQTGGAYSPRQGGTETFSHSRSASKAVRRVPPFSAKWRDVRAVPVPLFMEGKTLIQQKKGGREVA